MPVGDFLDALPAFVFVAVHLMLLAVGAVAMWRANAEGATYAAAFGLYAVSQAVFLAFFGGAITMKLAVLIEQMLVVAAVVWIAVATVGPKRART